MTGNTSAANPSRYSAPALEKGMAILEVLSESTHGCTMNELSARLARSVSEIFRMVIVLEKLGYIAADASDRYTLTLRLFHLAHRHYPVRQLTECAVPLLQELAVHSQQSCHLSIYRQGRLVIIAQVDSPARWSLSLKLGTEMGLGDTSSGQVLLAFCDDEERARMLQTHVPTDGELILPEEQLRRQLAKVRKAGYSVMKSRQIQGVTNIAAPVRNEHGQVIAAINVPHIARIDALQAPSAEAIRPMLLNTAERISRRLGHE
ncbi:MAG: IclR family transcriptional regulator [Advenella sp.]|uniref:IclR family transcriptional regulator n=1 Tax=Advenella sp. TaxID=1872388 RepID=UPI003F9A6870